MSNGLDWIPVNDAESRPFSAMEFEFLKEQVSQLSDQVSIKDDNIELFKEELNAVVGRMADASASQWVDMTSGAANQGLQLSVLKGIAQRLRDASETNPLMRRGHQLRRDYVYARGVDLNRETMKPRVKKAVNDPFNEELLFTEEGHDALMRARYTDGNRFILVNKKDKTSIHVPLEQISNAICDPMDPSRIKYIERSFNGGTMWFATDLYDATGKAKPSVQITTGGQRVSVNRDWVMVHKAFNRPTGATWGLPDALPAYLWMLAYSNYLKDNAALVKAYSSIALKVSASTKAGAQNASASFATTPGSAGGVAAMAKGIDVTAMPTSGSNVNFNNGRPLAAMVATSLGVSIVALLSDPGTGGSYGVAETLDPPTLLLAQTLQASEAEYYKRILRLYGDTDPQVRFPSIDSDPAYRTLQSIYLAVAQGLLSREEARPLIAFLLDISNLDESDLPEPDGFNSWNDPDPTGASPAVDDGTVGSTQPGQGNQGAVPGGVDQGQTNNDGRTD